MKRLVVLLLLTSLLVSCSKGTNSCEVKEDVMNRNETDHLGISPNYSGLVTITVFLEEKPTERLQDEVRQSIRSCEVDYIVYVVNPSNTITDRFDIQSFPMIIVGGRNEKVLLKTKELAVVKEFFH